MAGEEEYDVVVVGAGSGGVRAARFAAKNYGQRTAVVELPFSFVSGAAAGGAGGTCVIRGCVPKKLFVYGSEFGGGSPTAAASAGRWTRRTTPGGSFWRRRTRKLSV